MEEVGKPLAEVFSKMADSVAAHMPRIIEGVSSLAPKIKQAGAVVTTALEEAIQGDSTRLFNLGLYVGELIAEGIKLGAKAAHVSLGESFLKSVDATDNFIREMTGLDQIMGRSNVSGYVTRNKKSYLEGEAYAALDRIQLSTMRLQTGMPQQASGFQYTGTRSPAFEKHLEEMAKDIRALKTLQEQENARATGFAY
jgi:hypothetical protein